MPELANETEAKLRSALEVATRNVDAEALEVIVDVDVPGRVGAVLVPEAGGSVVLNDENADTVDEALAGYGWESGTARLTERGMAISVWEGDDAE